MPTILLAILLRVLLPSDIYPLQEQGQADNQTQKEQQSQPSNRKDDSPQIDPNKPGGARLRVTLEESLAVTELRPGEKLVGVTDQDVRIADREIPKGSKVTMEVVAPKNDESPELRLLSIEVGKEKYKTHSEKALRMEELASAHRMGSTGRASTKDSAATGQATTAAGRMRTAGRTVVFLLKVPPELEDQNRK